MAKSSAPGARRSGAGPEQAGGTGERTVQPVAEAAETVAAPKAKLRPIELIAAAKQQLKELTGYTVDSVAGFRKNEEGWSLTVTVLELHRIPTATDVLAEYVVDLDADGDVIEYRRGRRFYRGEVGVVE